MQLSEQYRPTHWSEVLGQDKILAKLDRLRKRGLAGRAYWLYGPSGVGKTTIGRLIAADVADEWCIEEVDASGLSDARIREIESKLHHHGLGVSNGKTGQAVIVNEAHCMNRGAVRQLLTTLERIPDHVVWVFTTSNDGQDHLLDNQDDAHPLLSRCVDLPLARRSLTKVFAQRAREIATQEGLNGRPIEAYERLAETTYAKPSRLSSLGTCSTKPLKERTRSHDKA